MRPKRILGSKQGYYKVSYDVVPGGQESQKTPEWLPKHQVPAHLVQVWRQQRTDRLVFKQRIKERASIDASKNQAQVSLVHSSFAESDPRVSETAPTSAVGLEPYARHSDGRVLPSLVRPPTQGKAMVTESDTFQSQHSKSALLSVPALAPPAVSSPGHALVHLPASVTHVSLPQLSHEQTNGPKSSRQSVHTRASAQGLSYVPTAIEGPCNIERLRHMGQSQSPSEASFSTRTSVTLPSCHTKNTHSSSTYDGAATESASRETLSDGQPFVRASADLHDHIQASNHGFHSVPEHISSSHTRSSPSTANTEPANFAKQIVSSSCTARASPSVDSVESNPQHVYDESQRVFAHTGSSIPDDSTNPGLLASEQGGLSELMHPTNMRKALPEKHAQTALLSYNSSSMSPNESTTSTVPHDLAGSDGPAHERTISHYQYKAPAIKPHSTADAASFQGQISSTLSSQPWTELSYVSSERNESVVESSNNKAGTTNTDLPIPSAFSAPCDPALSAPVSDGLSDAVHATNTINSETSHVANEARARTNQGAPNHITGRYDASSSYSPRSTTPVVSRSGRVVKPLSTSQAIPHDPIAPLMRKIETQQEEVQFLRSMYEEASSVASQNANALSLAQQEIAQLQYQLKQGLTMQRELCAVQMDHWKSEVTMAQQQRALEEWRARAERETARLSDSSNLEEATKNELQVETYRPSDRIQDSVAQELADLASEAQEAQQAEQARLTERCSGMEDHHPANYTAENIPTNSEANTIVSDNVSMTVASTAMLRTEEPSVLDQVNENDFDSRHEAQGPNTSLSLFRSSIHSLLEQDVGHHYENVSLVAHEGTGMLHTSSPRLSTRAPEQTDASGVDDPKTKDASESSLIATSLPTPVEISPDRADSSKFTLDHAPSSDPVHLSARYESTPPLMHDVSISFEKPPHLSEVPVARWKRRKHSNVKSPMNV